MIHPRIKQFYHKVAEYLWRKEHKHSPTKQEEGERRDWVDVQTERLARGYEAAYQRRIIKRDYPSRYRLIDPNEDSEVKRQDLVSDVWWEEYEDD